MKRTYSQMHGNAILISFFFFFFLTAWKMEIDNINPCRIFRSKKSAGAKILTEWKTALALIQMIC